MKPTQKPAVEKEADSRRWPPALGRVRLPQQPGASAVIYRGRVRSVRALIGARHQGHRYYVLAFKRGHAPKDAHLCAIGPRGQRHITGVVVRSDHCKPLRGGLR